MMTSVSYNAAHDMAVVILDRQDTSHARDRGESFSKYKTWDGAYGRGAGNSEDDPCWAERKGSLMEQAVCAFYGLGIDEEVREYGDDGKDHLIVTPDKTYRVNSKSCSAWPVHSEFFVTAKKGKWKFAKPLNCDFYIFGIVCEDTPTRAIVTINGWIDKDTFDEHKKYEVSKLRKLREEGHYNYYVHARYLKSPLEFWELFKNHLPIADTALFL